MTCVLPLGTGGTVPKPPDWGHLSSSLDPYYLAAVRPWDKSPPKSLSLRFLISKMKMMWVIAVRTRVTQGRRGVDSTDLGVRPLRGWDCVSSTAALHESKLNMGLENVPHLDSLYKRSKVQLTKPGSGAESQDCVFSARSSRRRTKLELLSGLSRQCSPSPLSPVRRGL